MSPHTIDVSGIMCYYSGLMFEEVIRALKLPIYTIAAALLLTAYVFAYYDYVHSMAPGTSTTIVADGQ
jgi:hypothetical protein